MSYVSKNPEVTEREKGGINMRRLPEPFLTCLKADFLSEITEFVRADHDLNLEIRDAYINIYYKGNSLLKLVETDSPLHYKAKIHEKFREGIKISPDFSKSTVPQFVKNIPLITIPSPIIGWRAAEKPDG
jgi:hypothetical protein